MKIVTKKLPEFAGFGVHYDPSAKPFFVSNLLQDLRQIASHPLGFKLLKEIAEAKPRIRSAPSTAAAEVRAIKFPKGINVMCTPTSVSYTQVGFKTQVELGDKLSMHASSNPGHNLADCPFHLEGGSFAAPADAIAAGNGTGSTSYMYYTNAQIITRKGESTYPFIVLAHELIHSLHHLTGSHAGKEEEVKTTGLPPYDKEQMSENGFRRAFGIKPREAY